MNLSDTTIAVIRDGLAKGQSHEDISRRARVSEYIVRDFEILFLKKWNVSDDGYGRVALRPFILCKRHVDGSWSRDDHAKLMEARRKYDAGLIDMAQGRDRYWIIQYVFPRRVVDKSRRQYFSRNFGEG